MAEKLTPAELLQMSVSVFRKEQEAKQAASRALIAKSTWELAQSEYHQALMDFKVQEGLPLDKGVDLLTGKSV